MPRRFRPRRPSHAVVVAYLALFVALGGTALAAATITGDDVVDGSLTGADVATGSLTGNDLQNAGVTSVDVLDGNLLGADLKDGTVAVPDVSPALRGVRGLEVVFAQSDALNTSSRSVTAHCPTGKVIVGGGAGFGGVGTNKSVLQSAPSASGGPTSAGWSVILQRTSGSDFWTAKAYAICAVPAG